MQSEIFLNQDGSGKATVGYAIMQSVLLGGPFDEYLTQDQTGKYLDKNALVKKINARPGLTVKKLDLWQKSETQYIRMHVDYENISNFGEQNVNYSWSVEDGAWTFRIIISKSGTKTPDSRVHQALMNGLKKQGFHFKVHLPERIIDSNAETVNWNVAEFFVPLTFFFQNDITTKVLYAKTEASRWERIKAWFADLLPD